MNINYSYLKPPAGAKDIQHPKDYIMKIDQNQKHHRRIFYNSEYDTFQLTAIQKLSQLLQKSGKNNIYNQSDLLRFCYAGNFDPILSLSKINIYEQWLSQISVLGFSQKTKEILQHGSFYTYGFDHDYRPIIIVNLGKINLQKYKLHDYYCAFDNLIKPIKQCMLLPGKIQSWNVIIDTQNKPSISIDVKLIGQIIEKMSAVYCCFLQNMFIVNLSDKLKNFLDGVKNLISNPTRQKIVTLSQKQIKNLVDKYLPDSSLQKKYGGRLQNLESYWPIKTIGKIYTEQSLKQEQISIQKSLYESINNDGQYFKVEQHNTGCCCGDEKCLIF